jgi:hypothetical protein
MPNSTAVLAVDMLLSVDVVISDNDVLGSKADVAAIDMKDTTTCQLSNNFGRFGPGTAYNDQTDHQLVAGAVGDSGFLFTIYGNTVHVGSVIRVTAVLSGVWDTPNGTGLQLRIGGAAIGPGTGEQGQNYDAFAQWDIKVVAIDGADNLLGASVINLAGSSTNDIIVDTTVDTVDMTVDQDVTFQVTHGGGASTATLKAATVEILGAANQP